MSEMMSAMGNAVKAEVAQDLASPSQVISAVRSGGGVTPLFGNMIPTEMKSLLGNVAAKNDPTKDPYKPEQPVMYDDKGSLKMPEDKYGGLISLMSGPAPANSMPDLRMPSLLPPAVPMVRQPEPQQSSLARKVFGSYL